MPALIEIRPKIPRFFISKVYDESSDYIGFILIIIIIILLSSLLEKDNIVFDYIYLFIFGVLVVYSYTIHKKWIESQATGDAKFEKNKPEHEQVGRKINMFGILIRLYL